jgi:hypothetical protein
MMVAKSPTYWHRTVVAVTCHPMGLHLGVGPLHVGC